MQKLAKRTAALACAMLMTVGAFSQASAAAVVAKGSVAGINMTGTAAKTGTVTASATTSYSGTAKPGVVYTVGVRAYVNMDGSITYGEWKYRKFETNAGAVKDSLPGSVYIPSGFGSTAGYGGQHRIDAVYSNGSKESTGLRTSSY